MHPEVLESEALELTDKLGFLTQFDFYLVGGTGLALQWGHRRSVDLDFFTKKEFTPDVLSSVIREHGISFIERAKAIGTLHCLLNLLGFYSPPLAA
jgi:hypothetical protein